MEKSTRMHRMGALVAVLLAIGMASGMAACKGITGDLSSLGIVTTRNANADRGGALWDKWWQVPDVKEGIEPGAVGSSLAATNPYYAGNAVLSDLVTPNPRAGSQTWRCKECHGWDYKGVGGAYGSGSHHSGFGGVLSSRGVPAEMLFLAIRSGVGTGAGASHAFGAVLSDDDIADLVKFIKTETIDDDPIINPMTKAALGVAVDGQPLFDANCASCHGLDGKTLNFDEGSYHSIFVADLAHDNPWETFHKIRFGQPDGQMPPGSASDYTLQDMSNILAYVQSLATPGLEQASAVRGGVLWDSWWVVTGDDEPGTGVSPLTASNPFYLANATPSTRTGSQTWRCKECHGWDYKGYDGAYGSGSHQSGFPGVFGTAKTAQQLVDAITDGDLDADGTGDDMGDSGQTINTEGGPVAGNAAWTGSHSFGAVMSASDIADLAIFILEDLKDSDDIIDFAQKRSTGSRVVGATLFDGNCAGCHGSDGLRINWEHGSSSTSAAEHVGELARGNPWELAHKIRYGQPGSDEEAEEMETNFGVVTGHMPNGLDFDYDENDVANIIAYAQSLRDSVERGGQAWDKWWKDPYIAEPVEPGAAGSSLPASNPFYLANATPSTRTGSQTWRCKECHGWDYKGYNGAYGSGSHQSGFDGVGPFGSGLTSNQLYAAIAFGDLNGDGTPDDMGDPAQMVALQGGPVAGNAAWTGSHSFINLFGDAKRPAVTTSAPGDTAVDPGDSPNPIIRDLVNFINSMPDYDAQIIDFSTKVALCSDRDIGSGAGPGPGCNLVVGQLLYQSTCMACHGADGQLINFAAPSGTEFVGDLARSNPWEFANKVLHGQPGSAPVMPNAAGNYWDDTDLQNLLDYVQQLP